MLLKNFCAVLLTLTFFMTASAWAEQDPKFSRVIEDLPLMAELVEVGEGVQFSTSQGRIAETTATGRIKPSDVISFYEKTLPQLGWSKVGQGRFAREGETLELGFEKLSGSLNVRFTLAPKK